MDGCHGYIVDILTLQLMLKSWNGSIFMAVREKLLSASMKLLYAERNGEAFDSQLVIGVRQSFGENFLLICLPLICSHTHTHTHTQST